MIRDPFVEEVHQVRRKLLEECGGDIDKYLDRLKALAATPPERAVTSPPRRKKAVSPA